MLVDLIKYIRFRFKLLLGSTIADNEKMLYLVVVCRYERPMSATIQYLALRYGNSVDSVVSKIEQRQNARYAVEFAYIDTSRGQRRSVDIGEVSI